jgi:drug/metabolite transporter (DMT)-like permease
MQNRAGLGIGFALAAAALYGLIPNASRAAFENGVPAVESTFLRTSIIAVVMAIVAILRGESFLVRHAGWPSFLAQAIATVAISVCYLAASQYVPVSLAVLIFFTFPVLILIMAPVIEGHRPSLLRFAIALAAFVGLAIAIGPGIDAFDWRGLALAGVASLGATLQFFSGRVLSRHLAPAALASMVHIFIWPITLTVALLYNGGSINFFPGGSVTGAGYAFLIGLCAIYCVAYSIHLLSLRMAPASVVAPYYNLEPVVTTAVAALILGERLSLAQYVGGGIILGALALASLAERLELAAKPMSPKKLPA